MPDEQSFFDQLEDWFEAQVPTNLHDLPFRMLETMERMSNDLIESLNVHGPPSISIPFPPFTSKDNSPPPPPPSTPLPMGIYHKTCKVTKAHPYAVGGVALAMTVGLGISGYLLRHGIKGYKFETFSTQGKTEDGMLKEAIVLLSPSPTPPLLIPLAASLLKAGYVVIVAVPHLKEAESIERNLGSLEGKALRVLIYDPEDSATFPPFHRSLMATLTLRYPARGHSGTSDSYNPQPSHIPHIHAFISLYPLNPSPPSQPGALPALPSLLVPGSKGRSPKLITLYPASSILPVPDTFASQILSANHKLLAQNLAVSSGTRNVSIYVGDLNLPTLPAMLSHNLPSRREQARLVMQHASTRQRVNYIKGYFLGGIYSVYTRMMGTIGIGLPARDYTTFERSLLRVVRHRSWGEVSLGQRSYLVLALGKLPPIILPNVLSIFPRLSNATGPLPPLPPKLIVDEKEIKLDPPIKSPGTEEDLTSSIHTHTSTSSRGEDSGSGGLEGSWIGLEGN